MDRELAIADVKNWVREQALESKQNYIDIPEGNLEEEIWSYARWNTLEEVSEKLNELLGEQ